MHMSAYILFWLSELVVSAFANSAYLLYLNGALAETHVDMEDAVFEHTTKKKDNGKNI